jgi:hypothetical protein
MSGALSLEQIIIIELLQLWFSSVLKSLKSLKLEPGDTQNLSQKVCQHKIRHGDN